MKLSEKYFYHGIDITMDVYEKIRRVVEMISENEAISFESLKTNLNKLLDSKDNGGGYSAKELFE